MTATELLALIRNGIKGYGYGPSRVVFELFQNADDATLRARLAQGRGSLLNPDGTLTAVRSSGRTLGNIARNLLD